MLLIIARESLCIWLEEVEDADCGNDQIVRNSGTLVAFLHGVHLCLRELVFPGSEAPMS